MMKNADRWNRSRGEYLREVGWFLGIFSSLFTMVASRIRRRRKKRKDAILSQKKAKKPKKTQKKKLSNLKQEKRKRYDSPGEKKTP
jgi:hypothetical protein